jgi:hypothetical protein
MLALQMSLHEGKDFSNLSTAKREKRRLKNIYIYIFAKNITSTL